MVGSAAVKATGALYFLDAARKIEKKILYTSKIVDKKRFFNSVVLMFPRPMLKNSLALYVREREREKSRPMLEKGFALYVRERSCDPCQREISRSMPERGLALYVRERTRALC